MRATQLIIFPCRNVYPMLLLMYKKQTFNVFLMFPESYPTKTNNTKTNEGHAGAPLSLYTPIRSRLDSVHSSMHLPVVALV